jgi:phage shock protein A
MGFFDRMSKVIRGNVNAALDKATDPAKQVELLIVEMEDQLRRARGETTKAMADEKRAAARLDESEQQVTGLRRLAVEREGPARDEVAAVLKEAEARLAEARREHREAADFAAEQQSALRGLEAKLRQVKVRKGTILAKLATAKQMGARVDALDEFERLAGKVDEREGAVDAEAEVAEALAPGGAPGAEAARRIDALDGGRGADLDERLAALKKKLEQ